MFDLDLIEQALARKVSVSELANARIEFAKLRKAMEEAPRVIATRNGIVRTFTYSQFPAHKAVLLVKADD